MCYDSAEMWVQSAKKKELLALIAEIAGDHHADETDEDGKRRIESVLWLSTRGASGFWRAKISPEDFLSTRGAKLA